VAPHDYAPCSCDRGRGRTALYSRPGGLQLGGPVRAFSEAALTPAILLGTRWRAWRTQPRDTRPHSSHPWAPGTPNRRSGRPPADVLVADRGHLLSRLTFPSGDPHRAGHTGCLRAATCLTGAFAAWGSACETTRRRRQWRYNGRSGRLAGGRRRPGVLRPDHGFRRSTRGRAGHDGSIASVERPDRGSGSPQR
jgi:hypothetical protein